MVTDAIIGFFADLASTVLGLLPRLAVPSWLADTGTDVATLNGYLSGTGSIVPWDLVFLALALIFGAIGISVAIRGFRIVASFLTLGGGS